MNGADKLECYIALGCKGLPGTNTLASWAIKFTLPLCRQDHFNTLVKVASHYETA
jgi:hypothetical protein